jgi:hypothetical protein
MAFRIVAALAAAGAVLTMEARADTLTEDNVESRLVLLFQADAAALQKRLAPELEVSPAPAGPAKGSNLFVVLYDRVLQQDGEAKTTGAAAMRFAVVVAAVKERATGKPGFAVLRAFVPDPGSVPGFYGMAALADVARETSFEAKGLEPGLVKDEWNVKSGNGDTLRVRIEYARGVPARRQGEMHVFSAAHPELHRIYRTDEATDVVRSPGANVDRAKKLDYRFAIRDMADLFVPETRLVAALANPLYLRKVFVPERHAQR